METVEIHPRVLMLLLLAICVGAGGIVFTRLWAEPEPEPRPSGSRGGTAAEVAELTGGTGLSEFNLPPAEAYAEIAERPLFRKERQPPEPVAEALGENPEALAENQQETKAADRFALIGVVTTPDKRVALLRDLEAGEIERLVRGQKAGNWAVVAIESNEVKLKQGPRVEALELVRGPLPVVKPVKRKGRGRRPRRAVNRRQP